MRRPVTYLRGVRQALIVVTVTLAAGGCGGGDVPLADVKAALERTSGTRCGEIDTYETDTFQTPHLQTHEILTCGPVSLREGEAGPQPKNALASYSIHKSPVERIGGPTIDAQLYEHGNVTIIGLMPQREWQRLIRYLPRNEATAR